MAASRQRSWARSQLAQWKIPPMTPYMEYLGGRVQFDTDKNKIDQENHRTPKS